MGDAAVPPDNGAPKITGGDGQGTIRSFSNMLNQKYATKRIHKTKWIHAKKRIK